MLSIGKLATGAAAAAYYLERVGCPLEYYTGAKEAAGRWIGGGADALGLTGALDSPRQQDLLRSLLAGSGPDGSVLVKPVLRADPRSRVPTTAVVHAVEQQATLRDVPVDRLLGSDQAGTQDLLRAWQRATAELERARRRPRWPAPTLPVDTARRLLETAGLEPSRVLAESTPTGRVRDLFARAWSRRQDRVDVRLPGLDLTFSAPKSVSVLYALAAPGSDPATAAGERVAKLAQRAHRLAVAEAVAYLELSCATALRGHHRGDGTDRRVATDGLIGAAFEHRSSRCGDPQLHTHVVVANLVHGADGKWSALDTRELYAQARTAGFVYQAVLRGELTRTLGVTWRDVRNGQAEIAGLPTGLLRLFSKRRRQIEAQLELVGLDSPAAAQAATLVTRPAKPHPDGGGLSLAERWQAEARASGFPRDVVHAALHQAPMTQVMRSSRDAAAAAGELAGQLTDALLAPDGLTEKRASFDRRDLLRGVCERLPAGTPVRLSGLRALATRVLRDDRVLPLLGDVPVRTRRYSTRELLNLEGDALATAQRRGASGANSEADRLELGTVPPAVLASAGHHARTLGLSPQQTAMLQRLLSSGAGVDVVVGAAGSGKTAALAVAARAWAQAGVPVQGTALAAIAARVLQDSAGIPSCSLQRLLNRVDRQPSGTASDHVDAGGLPHGGVLVVDEAGMVGTRTLHRLLTLAERSDTKLVLVGDPRQLPEIDAGGLFATLAQRLPSAVLTGNQRQQQPWEQKALRELRDGDVLRALSTYQRHDRLRVTDGIGELTASLLDDYERHLTRHDPDRVLVIASSRGDARRLNAQLRERMLQHGRLGAVELRISVGDGAQRGYRTGEQVLVTANDYQRGLLNGTRGTVTDLHSDQQAVTVRLDDGRTVRLDRDYLRRGQLTHGYALTAHKAQGVTVDVAMLWGTHALTRETGYVALSRGRHANYLYSTWDLLRRDAGLADSADLDLPLAARRPDPTAQRVLSVAGLAERLAASGAQRTARSWWRPTAPTSRPAARPVTPPVEAARPRPGRSAGAR